MCYMLFTEDPPISLPVMSILESVGGEPSEVCLAESFSDKNEKIHVTAEGADNILDLNKALLSTKSKTYYFATFHQNIEKCSLGDKKAERQSETEIPPTNKGMAQTLNACLELDGFFLCFLFVRLFVCLLYLFFYVCVYQKK